MKLLLERQMKEIKTEYAEKEKLNSREAQIIKSISSTTNNLKQDQSRYKGNAEKEASVENNDKHINTILNNNISTEQSKSSSGNNDMSLKDMEYDAKTVFGNMKNNNYLTCKRNELQKLAELIRN
jgi:hypothetical protein